MTGRWSEFAPRKVAALRAALIALSVVVLLPACSAFASQARGAPASAVSGHLGSAAGHAQHHAGAASANWCASVGNSATAVAAERPPEAGRGALLAIAPVAPPYPVATMFLPQSAAASYPPPFKASFYIRSTRILR